MTKQIKHFTGKQYNLFRRLLTQPLYQFALVLWCAFASLFFIFYIGIAPKSIGAGHYILPVISGATLFTLPLFWCKPRWRWTLWTVFGLLTVFVLINLLYYRNFFIPVPLSGVFMLKNLDPMVIEAVRDSLSPFIPVCFIPIVSLVIIWWCYFHKRIKGVGYSRKVARRATIAGLAVWAVAQISSLAIYVTSNFDKAPLPGQSMSVLYEIKDKYRGKVMTHTEYLFCNGFEFYIFWALGDFSPTITPDSSDIALISAYTKHQNELYASHPVTFEKDTPLHRKTPNLLIIMIESFETWPLEMKINGHPCLEYLDSLIQLPGTLYFPHIVSQAASGRSSDGHLLCLTGLLPLRESPTVVDFYENDYPTLIKAYNEKYGGSTFEIISDDPTMWNQYATFKHYGFEKLYDINDMDTDKVSSWLTRDYYWGKFTSNVLKDVSTPFACMTVSLSLHTPYRAHVSGFNELDELEIPTESIHYLKVCKQDEQYIAQMIDALRQHGIYDNTVIVITGDHVAHGLFDDARPAHTRGKEKFLPLIVLNSGYKTHTYPYTAGQIDIYPTLLDILGLHDYQWRGLGLSLLRFTHSSATRSNLETVGNPTPEEKSRQSTAWKVSNLLIRSNYLGNR